MTQLERVAIIAGGLSHEREISLESGREALNVLRAHGLHVEIYEPDSMLLSRLVNDGIQVCYIALHGRGGEDGTLQEALEFLQIPFVGPTSQACRRGWDKVTARVNLAALDIPLPVGCSLSASQVKAIGLQRLQQRLAELIGYPMVVKPTTGGSAQGLCFVPEENELATAIPRTLAYGDAIVFEKAVLGREISVTVCEDEGEPRAMPPVELLIAESDRFDFSARHDPTRLGYAQAGDLPGDAGKTMTDMAITAHRGLGLRDFSRSDFVVDAGGNITLLEVSLSPGLAKDSSVSAGLSYGGKNLGDVMATLMHRRFTEN